MLEQGIRIDVVAGTSIGAIVGASYACGNLDRLKAEALAINRLNWPAFFNPSFSFDGWINKHHMQMFLVKSGIARKKNIEELDMPFGTVTCDIETGKEIWMTSGSVFDSVWPSMAMPGVFPPVYTKEERWCIDGGVVNPVPVSLCRALGADVVIAVNLNSDLIARTNLSKTGKKPNEANMLLARAYQWLPSRLKSKEKPKEDANSPQHPDFFDTVSATINLVQDRITRTRLAGDPPEYILQPKLARIGLLETYRASEAIEAGRKCAEANIRMLKDAIGI